MRIYLFIGGSVGGKVDEMFSGFCTILPHLMC